MAATGSLPTSGPLTMPEYSALANEELAVLILRAPVILSSVAGTNTITGTTSPATAAYALQESLWLVPAITNTGAVTVNRDGLGAKTVLTNLGAALSGGELVAGSAYLLFYDDTSFLLQPLGDARISDTLAQFASTTSAQLAGVISDETGTGSLVFATSATLVTPALGTPSAAVLTNATGLPIATGLATGTSANLASVISDETGTGSLVFGTSPTLVTPALGTPSAAVLTNATALPIATGIAPGTSANLASVITDETGTGSLVFATSATLVTPALGTPSVLVLTNATGLPVSGLANGTDGELITWDSSGVAATVAVGTTGDALLSNGAGAAPTFQTLPGGGNALTTNPLSQFAATTSLQLAGVMSDETGTGSLVFST